MNTTKISLLLLCLVLSGLYGAAQNVGIGTTTPNPAAKLEIADSSKGVLIPRLTAKQRKQVQNPPPGLILFQTDDSSGIWYFDQSWKLVAPVADPASNVVITGNWSLTGNTGTDSVGNFLGTIDSQRVNIRTNNTERMRIEGNGLIRLNKYKNTPARDSVLTTDSLGQLVLSASAGGNSVTLDSISHLQKYGGLRTIAYVRDSARGGIFHRYVGNAPADDGIVFTDSLSRKWRRYIPGNVIDVRWFGAQSKGFAFDNFAALTAALKACRDTNTFSRKINNALTITSKMNVKKLYIPTGKDFYYSTGTLVIDGDLEIESDKPNAILYFPYPLKGVVVKYPWYCSIKNLTIKSNAPSNSVVDTLHGFTIKTRVYFDNVSAQGFGGDGFNIECDLATDTLKPSNANTSGFYNCHAVENRRNGFRLKGGDANAINFYSCEAVSNGALGVDDQSFLGNSYHGFHSASNSAPDLVGQRSIVKRGAKCFAAIRDSFLVEPEVGVNWQNDWVEVTSSWTIFAPVIAYNPSTIYYAGGAYNLDGKNAPSENQTGTVVGCYSEGDQPPSYFGQRSLVIGGTQGSGIRKGVYLHADAQSLKTPNTFIAYDKANPLRNSFLNNIGVGNAQTGNEGVVLKYDDSLKMGIIRPFSGYEIRGIIGVAFGMPTTVASIWGRPSNDMNTSLMAPKMFIVNKDNTTAHLLQPAWTKPASPTNYIGGDLLLNAPYFWGSEKNDVLGWRVAPTGGSNALQWMTLKTDNEYAQSTVNATAVLVEDHPNITGMLRFEIDITCSDNADHYWTEKRNITVGKNGSGNAYIREEQYENKLKDPTLDAALLWIACSTDDVFLNISGIAATTLKWKLQIKRIAL
jgi:hypothetical protein